MDHSVYTDCEFCGAVRYTEEANIGKLINCLNCDEQFEVPYPTLRGTCPKCDDPFLICGDAGEKVQCAACESPLRFENVDLKEIKNPLKYGPKPTKATKATKRKGDEEDDEGALTPFDPKKLAPLAALLLVGLGVWFFVLRDKTSTPAPAPSPPPNVAATPASPSSPSEPTTSQTPSPANPAVATTPLTEPAEPAKPTEPEDTSYKNFGMEVFTFGPDLQELKGMDPFLDDLATLFATRYSKVQSVRFLDKHKNTLAAKPHLQDFADHLKGIYPDQFTDKPYPCLHKCSGCASLGPKQDATCETCGGTEWTRDAKGSWMNMETKFEVVVQRQINLAKGVTMDEHVDALFKLLNAGLVLMSKPLSERLLKAHHPDMSKAINERKQMLYTVWGLVGEKLEEMEGRDEDALAVMGAMAEHELVATTLLAAQEIAKARGVDFGNRGYPKQTIDLSQPPNIDQNGRQKLFLADEYSGAIQGKKIYIHEIFESMSTPLYDAIQQFIDGVDGATFLPSSDVAARLQQGYTEFAKLGPTRFTGDDGTAATQPDTKRPTAKIDDIDADRKAYVAAVQKLRQAKFSRRAASWFMSKHGTNPAGSDQRMIKLLRGIYNMTGEQESIEARCTRCAGANALNQFCPTCRGRKTCNHCNGVGTKTMRSLGGEKSIPCTNCRQTGKCTVCHGLGSRNTGPCPTCNDTKVYIDRRKMAETVSRLSEQIIKREQMLIKGSTRTSR